jgi:hypothetical protein
MTQTPMPAKTQPGRQLEVTRDPDNAVVNDSLGTVDIADSTGLEEERETGDAKVGNTNTRED